MRRWRWRDSLRTAGRRPVPDETLEALVEAAEDGDRRETKAEALRQKAKERRADVGRAEVRLTAAEQDDTRWRAAWRRACAESWLGQEAEAPALGEVRQALKALDDLRGALKDCADLDHRIGAMEHDRRIFAAEVGDAALALGLAPDDEAGRLADLIASRVAAARENARRRRREDKSVGRRARKARDDRRGARGQREARLGDDGFLRRQRACRRRGQARRLQAARRVAPGDRQGDARHSRAECRELLRSRARGSRRRRPRRARAGAQRAQDPRRR